MGSEVWAKCQCGLNAKILIGGGMDSFTDTCYFPCFCNLCRTIVEVNLLAPETACPLCKNKNIIPYDDPAMSQQVGKREVANWNMARQLGRDLKLTNGDYKCPQCEQMTLHFSSSGLRWD